MARRHSAREPGILLALALAPLAGCCHAPGTPAPDGGARSVTTAAARPDGDAPDPACLDLIVRGGTVFDGTGAPGRAADVGICGDRVSVVGDLSTATAPHVVDARGLAVAPGFVNMLSWATESLLADGRALSDVKQGVTLRSEERRVGKEG